MKHSVAIFSIGLAAMSAEAGRDGPGVPVTRWMNPDGRPKPAHTAPAFAGPLAIRRVDAPATEGASDRLCIVVESNLLAAIATDLEAYQLDLRRAGFVPVVYRYDSGGAEGLRSRLVALHAETNSLVGAVLIGAIPHIVYEMTQDWGLGEEYEDFPCDQFYMDLDGTWADQTNTPPFANGKYDTRGGDWNLDIWVSRMNVAPLTSLGSSTGILRRYFDKNRRYRAGKLVPHRAALVYDDDDWDTIAGDDAATVAEIYGDINVVPVRAPETTTAGDYLGYRLTNNLELIATRSHGYPGGHGYYENSRAIFNFVYPAQYRALLPRALFYSFFVCSGADFTANDYLAGTAAFNTNDAGLASWGSAKTGGMLEDKYFYHALGEGRPIGEAFKTWYNTLNEMALSWFPPWFLGMALIGDGSLTLSDCGAGATSASIEEARPALAWSASPGACYRLQRCDALDNAQWSAAGEPVTAADFSVTLTDTNPVAGFQVYRLLRDDSGPSNLLTNGSFEFPDASTDTVAKGWAGWPGGTWGNASRENWRAHGGGWEATIKTSWGGTGENFGGWWQPAAVIPGQIYEASAWFWADNTLTASVRELKIEFYDSGDGLLSTFPVGLDDVGQSWTQKTVAATAPPSAASAHFAINVSGAGDAGALQADDARFVPVP